jgi:hypothetical protein
LRSCPPDSVVVVRSRFRSLIAVALIAAVASSCSTLTGSDLAINVEGEGYTTAEMDGLLAEYFSESDIFGTTALDTGGYGDADRARLLLNAMVRTSAVEAILDRAGASVTDSDLDLYFATIPSDSPLNELSDAMRRLIAMTSADVVLSALTRADLPSDTDLEAMYAAQPISTGLLCLRHILVATEAEADGVVALLVEGEDFAALAADLSLEGSASITGGALTGTESECLPTAQYISSFDPDFVSAAFAAPATTWSQPVETQFGWHVILNRPWSEIGQDVVAAYAGTDGALLYVDAVLNTAEVSVDSRFGRWNPSTGRIVPLG